METKSENQLVKFRREHIGFIFQSFNLMGTMNAVENVALPLTFQGISKRERKKRARKMVHLVGHFILIQRLSLQMSRQEILTPIPQKR